MQWYMKSVRASIYSLGRAYNNIPKLGHDDLFNSLQLKPEMGHIDLFWSPLQLLTYMDPKSTPTQRKCIPLPTPFADSVVGKFHVTPWLGY